MSPTTGSMAGYPYGSSSGYAGAMYAAAASTPTTKDSTSFSSSLMAAGDSINSLRLKAKQHSTSSSPTAIGSSYYPAASVSPGKSNASDSPSLAAAAAAAASDLYNSSAMAAVAAASTTSSSNGAITSCSAGAPESVWISPIRRSLRFWRLREGSSWKFPKYCWTRLLSSPSVVYVESTKWSSSVSKILWMIHFPVKEWEESK